jgi:hypothetical protein
LFLARSPDVASFEKIFVEKEIDDDHIIIRRSDGQRLLLETWSVRFYPDTRGKQFIAEAGSLWVMIYIEGRDPLKWTTKETLGVARPTRPPSTSQQPPMTGNSSRWFSAR